MKIVDFYDNLTEGGDLVGAGRDPSVPQVTGDELNRQLKNGFPNAFVQIIFRSSEIIIGTTRQPMIPERLGKDDDSFGPPKSDE